MYVVNKLPASSEPIAKIEIQYTIKFTIFWKDKFFNKRTTPKQGHGKILMSQYRNQRKTKRKLHPDASTTCKTKQEKNLLNNHLETRYAYPKHTSTTDSHSSRDLLPRGQTSSISSTFSQNLIISLSKCGIIMQRIKA